MHAEYLIAKCDGSNIYGSNETRWRNAKMRLSRRIRIQIQTHMKIFILIIYATCETEHSLTSIRETVAFSYGNDFHHSQHQQQITNNPHVCAVFFMQHCCDVALLLQMLCHVCVSKLTDKLRARTRGYTSTLPSVRIIIFFSTSV